MAKVEIYIRDLTSGVEFPIVLPDTEGKLLPNHEYIILDGVIDCGEFAIRELDNFLKNNPQVELDDILILQKAYLWSEITEAIENESYTILNFTEETSDWYGGSGAIPSDENLGLLMYELGFNDLPCRVPSDLIDYINWEANWTSLQCGGWTKVNYNQETYIVHI